MNKVWYLKLTPKSSSSQNILKCKFWTGGSNSWASENSTDKDRIFHGLEQHLLFQPKQSTLNMCWRVKIHMAHTFSKLNFCKLGQIFWLRRSSAFFARLVDSENLGTSTCEHAVVVTCLVRSGHMTLWSGRSDGFAKSPTAPKTFPSTASKSTVLAIKITCSSAWIIIATSMSASGVYLLESQATEGFISTMHFKISSWNDTSYMP